MMPRRFALTFLALFTMLALAACNASQPIAIASLQARVPPNGAPPDFHLPAGAACTADINRYATIVYGDNQTGMVDHAVFEQIRVELAKAADACRAGHDAKARALVAASQRKHGYPPSA